MKYEFMNIKFYGMSGFYGFVAGFSFCFILMMFVLFPQSKKDYNKEIIINITNRPNEDDNIIESILQCIKIDKYEHYYEQDINKLLISAKNNSKEKQYADVLENIGINPRIELEGGFLSVNLEAVSSQVFLDSPSPDTSGMPGEMVAISRSGPTSSNPLADVELASLSPFKTPEIGGSVQYSRSPNFENDLLLQVVTPKIRETLRDFEVVSENESFRVVVPGADLFAGNSRNLASNARDILRPIVEVAEINDGYTLKIIGHTDGIKSVDQSKSLSLHRAGLVKNLLSDMLRNENVRLEADGKGKEFPIASNATLDGRRENRRVEILFVR